MGICFIVWAIIQYYGANFVSQIGPTLAIEGLFGSHASFSSFLPSSFLSVLSFFLSIFFTFLSISLLFDTT